MVPALRSKVAYGIAVAILILSSIASVVSHRSASRAEETLRVRTADLTVALDSAAVSQHRIAVLDSVRQRDSVALAAEHAHRVAADARADSLRTVFLERARVAPDTCGPVMAAALDALQSEEDADSALAGELRLTEHDRDTALSQRDSARAALGRLMVVAAPAALAARDVAQPSAGRRLMSFLGKLSPSVGVGGAIGIDPMTNRPSKTVGLTLGWHF